MLFLVLSCSLFLPMMGMEVTLGKETQELIMSKDDVESVKAFLASCNDEELRRQLATECLFVAARYARPAILEFLVHYPGVDVNSISTDEMRRTPMHMLVTSAHEIISDEEQLRDEEREKNRQEYENRKKAFYILLEAGADLTMRDGAGQRVIDVESWQCWHKEIKHFLKREKQSMSSPATQVNDTAAPIAWSIWDRIIQLMMEQEEREAQRRALVRRNAYGRGMYW